LVGVLSTVDFDDQFSLKRAEIYEVGADRMLAAEFHSARTLASKVTPEDLLGRSLLAAQPARGFVRCFGRGRHGSRNFAVLEKYTRHTENQNLESRAKPRAE
jgi:hypothetical protein